MFINFPLLLVIYEIFRSIMGSFHNRYVREDHGLVHLTSDRDFDPGD